MTRCVGCPTGWSDAEEVAKTYGFGRAGAILVAKTLGMLVVADDGQRLQVATDGDGIIPDSF